MSRPRLKDEDRRVVPVNIRLTTSESERVNEYAAASDLTPANWIRKKIFTGKFPQIKVSPLDAEIYRELHKIGVNLNQATHKINSGQIPRDYVMILAELSMQIKKIINALVNDGGPSKG
ncbi:plasmid mobilization relaxosome protein MobC [Fulvivirgaceae bacterium PWU5]|uniref:Plasmid mobilization relaxosome protein MobC n=1 Tax=Dawidia cretensis TaxID=2782350 RepID=A0AAP2E5C0_9BACT|nr:plasmid mobilization relaxosome protein MobC [Dawidia cretensis]MBT1712307.1 plasmid mobilization relaxosome protein MobC [Dawidia cretensis]